MVIRLGEPIETSGYKVKQKHELAERLQGAVATLLAEEERGSLKKVVAVRSGRVGGAEAVAA